MSNLILAFAIALVTSIVAPLVLSRETNRQNRADKREDWAREDARAEREEERARAAEKVAADLLASNAEVAATAKETNGKLDVIEMMNEKIHVLVNSKFTKALQGQLVALEALLNMMQDEPPTDERAAAQASVEAQIEELRAELVERAEATADAEAIEDRADEQEGRHA